MRGHAFDPYIEPANRLTTGDYADAVGVVFQNRALLDMRFEIRIHCATQRALTVVAGGAQRLVHADTVDINGGQCLVQGERAGEHRRAQHGRGETGALLVGPHCNFQRLARLDAVVVEAADDLQASQHAVHPIEASAFGLGIQVAAHHHRGGVIVGARAAGEQVADGIHAQRQAGCFTPVAEQLTTGLVFSAQRQAAAATACGRADLGHVHQATPQALAINLQHC